MRYLPFVLALALCGCSTFVGVEMNFVLINDSPETIQVIIAGQDAGPEVNSQGAAQFTARISVPRPTNDYGTSIRAEDQMVSVSVVFRRIESGRLSRVLHCYAGGRYVTTLVYEVSEDGRYDSAYCRTD